MADDVNSPAVESSPAAPAVEVPTDSAAYAEWRMTGKLPENGKPKREAPATSNGSSAATEQDAEKSQLASEAGNSQQEKRSRSNAETRLNEILADLKKAGLSPAELKSFKREATKEIEQPKAVPETTAKPAGLDAPKKPKADDFKTWEEYEAARDEYFENLADYKAGKKLEDWNAQHAQQAQAKELAGKFADAKKRYGDEAEGTITETAKTLWNDQKIFPAIKDLMGGSDVLIDVLYVMGSKPEDLDSFAQLARSNPAAAVRKFVLLEHLVAEELRKSNGSSSETDGTQRDESGKFTKSPPAKPPTSAPPPPREASGRSSVPPDEVERAGKEGDFTRFREAANRRDIDRRKGR
jgi:hypothetical protein